ncbi:MAG: hypothetical protein EOP40_07460, partial [Rubrivivax sp.]
MEAIVSSNDRATQATHGHRPGGVAASARDEHRLHERRGAHLTEQGGVQGVRFDVWAPNAQAVSVIGDFNGWRYDAHPLERVDTDGRWGVWTGFVPGALHGQRYKFHLQTPSGAWVDKADPFARCAEAAPLTASRIWSLEHTWHDEA